MIDTWETEDGLPENSATAIVQTPDGFIWFGTFNGLVRFDGMKFTVLDPANTSPLPSAQIVNLHLDKRGWLWVSTDAGLVVRQSDGRQWRLFSEREGWKGNYVRSFAERANGDLLLTTFDGHVLEFANGRLSELPNPGGRAGHGYLAQVNEANQWRVGQQWLAASFDGQHWTPEPAISNLFGRITGFGAARDRGSWILARRELIKIRQGQQISRMQLPEMVGSPWSVTEDSQGNVWIATYDHGLSRVSPTGQFRRWATTNGLSYTSTRFVFEDRENNLWVGTSGGGLQRFKPRRFQSFGPQQGLAERVVRCVAPAPDGSIWIATYGKGLFRLNDTLIEPVRLPGRDPLFSYTQTLLADRAGRMWVGTYGQSAWIAGDNGFHLVGADRTGGHNIFALFEDSRSRVWIASDKRVAVSEGGQVRLLPEHPDLAGVRCFAEDREGLIWLANRNGVFRLENERPVEVRDGAAPLREISCLKAGPNGTLWLGSLRAGLLCRRNGRMATIGPAAGLPVSTVYGILEDRQGHFWLSSNRGVARVRHADLLAVAEGTALNVSGEIFDVSDGLPSVECAGGQQPACAVDAAGRLWFATAKGVAMVDPARLRLNTIPPPVQIESVSYIARTRTASPDANPQRPNETGFRIGAPLPENVRLPAGTRRIEIHYTAPSFVAPERVRFQVKLEGQDPDWHDAGNSRAAEFFELPPRAYRFQVRAANNDGVWNETGASLAFAVEPFLWQTGWFRLVVLWLLFSAGGATAWWQLRSRHRRALEEVQRNRQQEAELAHVARVSTMGELAASLAHELNQPLGAILSNADAAELFLEQSPPALDELREILADIRKDDERAGQVIRRMRVLLRKRELEMTPLDLNSVVEDVLRLVSADASLRRTAIRAELSSRLPQIRGDRVHLQQVLLNLVVNAMQAMAKQPPDQRRLTVATRLHGDSTVEVKVIDSGCGLEPENLNRLFEPFYTTKPNGMGMGLSIARRIVEAHQGAISAENTSGGGATFRVTLPTG